VSDEVRQLLRHVDDFERVQRHNERWPDYKPLKSRKQGSDKEKTAEVFFMFRIVSMFGHC
jgi:hypothetical protein